MKILMKILTLCLTVIFISCGKETISQIEDPKENMKIGWQSSQPIPQPYKIDQLPGIAKYKGEIYLLGDNGTMWNNFDDNQWNGWALHKGPSLDNLVKMPQPRMSANFPNFRTEGNEWCYYWLMGLWIDETSGHFYSIAYSEYNYLNGWVTEAKERRLGLAISKDEGATWSYQGDIVTQDKSNAAPVNKQFYGVGDISFLIPGDGYAYIYYKQGFYSLENLNRTDQNISVARCKLSDKLAPNSWKKFYQGTWEQDGLGGKESTIIPFVNIANVVYNTYLERYVCIGNAPSGKSFISFASSMEKQDWTERDFNFPQVTSYYNWQVDEQTGDSHVVGKDIRLYTAGIDKATNQRTGNYYKVSFNKE
ncbi:hypothetical protein ACFRAE_06385 [Sphingobacterium sp. HJSM2_6]|uniref:hypothetical protein n=1 Tax=Sphingobacterium sp. HJSM2_6 TaxID=3366264 RepID=UPI003BDCBEB6